MIREPPGLFSGRQHRHCLGLRDIHDMPVAVNSQMPGVRAVPPGCGRSLTHPVHAGIMLIERTDEIRALDREQ